MKTVLTRNRVRTAGVAGVALAIGVLLVRLAHGPSPCQQLAAAPPSQANSLGAAAGGSSFNLQLAAAHIQEAHLEAFAANPQAVVVDHQHVEAGQPGEPGAQTAIGAGQS